MRKKKPGLRGSRPGVGINSGADPAGRKQSNTGSGENSLQFGDEGWKVLLDDGPQNIQVDLVIGMDKAVAQVHDIAPGNGRKGPALRLRDSRSGLADDFQEPDERQIELAVRVEIFAPAPVGHLDGFARVIEHLPKAHRRVMPCHTPPRPRPGRRRGSSGSSRPAC